MTDQSRTRVGIIGTAIATAVLITLSNWLLSSVVNTPTNTASAFTTVTTNVAVLQSEARYRDIRIDALENRFNTFDKKLDAILQSLRTNPNY